MGYDWNEFLRDMFEINPDGTNSAIEVLGMDLPDGLREFDPTSWDDQRVQQLLGFALQNQWKPDTIFLAPTNVWGEYLARQATQDKYREPIKFVAKCFAPIDLILFCRYWYNAGAPCLQDDDFDILEKLYIQTWPSIDSVHQQTYEEDELSDTLMGVINSIRKATESELKKLRLEAEDRVQSLTEGERESLDLDKSTSIRPVTSVEEAFEFWHNAPMVPVHFSLKVDGINTKLLVGEDGVKLSLSRGRRGDSLDYTVGAQLMLQSRGVNYSGLSGKVVGESAVDPTALDGLNAKYQGRDYKTPKSTANAMLRAPHQFDPVDYKGLHYWAFAYEDYPVAQAFDLLEKAGFETPPHFIVQPEEIPRTTVEEFNSWLNENVLEPLKKAGEEKNIGSDGVVMYLMESRNTERKDVYSDDNIAIKFGPWKAADYQSKVVGIDLVQRRVEISVVLIIEPVVTRDFNTATRVNVGSLALLVNDGIHVGDTIEFTRKSEAYNIYLRKVE